MAPGRPRLPSLRSLTGRRRSTTTSPGPPSPTFSDTTHVSAMNFGNDGPEKIITRANLKASLQAYQDLVDTCANYRAALVAMSRATAAFADAMSVCSGLKGPSYEAGTRMQAASGLHHLIGNQWHVLAENLDKKFEKPMQQHLDNYRTIVNERSASYESALREKSRVIRETEMKHMNRKERNLQSFREALAILQRQVDDLDDLKKAHYQDIMDHEEEVWDVVQSKVCLVVRSTMDVFDRFTAKASDPIIEPMLNVVPDPFDSYGPPQAEDQIFSILPPLSILSNQPSASPSPMSQTPEPEAFRGLPVSTTPPAWSNTNAVSFPSLESPSPSSSEWSDASPPKSISPKNTPPRSASPPYSQRRQSVPPVFGHFSRKSDSKLRSMLSVIDESQPRPRESRDIEEEHTHSRSSSTPTINGTVGQEPETSWTNFTYGQSPYATVNTDNDGDLTPRHSAMFSPESPPPLSEELLPSKPPDHVAHTPLPS
ncbi:hypothetical protein EYR40_005502 [Pleurotus pulmonarius]|nr:hypothetical protein EYR40_005502 [Pleurotus pulmonarius]